MTEEQRDHLAAVVKSAGGEPYGDLAKAMGIEYLEASAERVVGRMPVKGNTQPYGLLHGGVLCSIVETVGSVAGSIWFGDRGHVVGTSNHTNFLRAVREGVLTAVATPIHRGRTQQLWTVDIRDEQERLVAKGELRVANLPKE